MAARCTTGTLLDLLVENGVPEEIHDLLARDPWKVTTIKQFANYFENKGEVNTLFLSQTAHKDNGEYIANLKMAWREAEAAVSRSLKRAAEGMPEEALEDPLAHEVKISLDKMWMRCCSFHIPPTWSGFPSLLGRFHREFKKHSTVVYHITKIKNLDGILAVGPNTKRQKVGEMEFVMADTEKAAEIEINGLWQYCLGLRIVMHTMGLAGAFVVHKDGSDRLFCPMEPLMQHLASADAYILRHSIGKDRSSEHDILKQLITIDEAIRGEWATQIRKDENSTLGEICEFTKNLSSSLWLMSPTRSGQQQQPAKVQQAPDITRQLQSMIDKATKGRPPATPQPLGHPAKDTPSAKTANPNGSGKVKTCRANKEGKEFCKPWNDVRGCDNPRCGKKHACDIQLPNGSACNDTRHNRDGHRGPTVAL